MTNPLAGKKELGKEEQGVVGHAAAACAYLGKMYLRGEGVKADVRAARMWFMRGAEAGEKESHNGLGIIYRDGLYDGKPDLKKAIAYFGAAAGQDLAEAQVNLGKLYYGTLPSTLQTPHTHIPRSTQRIRHSHPLLRIRHPARRPIRGLLLPRLLQRPTRPRQRALLLRRSRLPQTHCRTRQLGPPRRPAHPSCRHTSGG